MGLFMGFSFVSITELIYYAIIRPYRSISKFTRTQNIYENMENGSKTGSSTNSSKIFRKSVKKLSNNVYPSVKIHNDKNRLFDHKMPLPYLLTGDFDKSGKNDGYVWLD